jgi:hypothetical protein
MVMNELCWDIIADAVCAFVLVYAIVNLFTLGDDGDDDPAFDGMGDDD